MGTPLPRTALLAVLPVPHIPGLRIKDHTTPSGVKCCEVETIVKNGAAEGTLKHGNGGLCDPNLTVNAVYPLLGDLLLTLNEQNLCRLTHIEVGERFTSSPPLVNLTIFRRALPPGLTIVMEPLPLITILSCLQSPQQMSSLLLL